MLVFSLIAAVLALAGVAQAVRLGVRRGEWLPLVLLVGFGLLAALTWLWATRAGGN